MSTGPSRKEQRRQAASREMERRAQETESRLRQAAAKANWGTATILGSELRDHIIRLGGLPLSPFTHSTVEILTRFTHRNNVSASNTEARHTDQ